MLRLEPWRARGASYHPAFVGNWPTVIHTFLSLSTHWMSSPSSKWECGVSPRFHLVAFMYGVNQEDYEEGGVQDSQHKWWKSSLQTSPAIKSYWAELHLELFILLWLNLGEWGELLIDSCLTISHTRLACLPSSSSVVDIWQNSICSSVQ